VSQRPGFVFDHFVRAEGRWPLTKSPNQHPDVISTQIRCHWPHTAPKQEILDALAEVYANAVGEVLMRFAVREEGA
jgi:hypothetical protein